jgi:hypothetical protein
MTTLYCRSLAPNLLDMATIGMKWGREMENGRQEAKRTYF